MKARLPVPPLPTPGAGFAGARNAVMPELDDIVLPELGEVLVRELRPHNRLRGTHGFDSALPPMKTHARP